MAVKHFFVQEPQKLSLEPKVYINIPLFKQGAKEGGGHLQILLEETDSFEQL